MDNQNWNDWKFQIHWNKFEWVNPRNFNEQKKSFCVSPKNLYMKYNNKTTHWVGHAKFKTLDTDDFFNRKNSLMKVRIV